MGMVLAFDYGLRRIGVAVGEAGGTPPSLSMVADHYPPAKRARAMSVFMLGPQLGILFGLALGGFQVSLRGGGVDPLFVTISRAGGNAITRH